VNVPLTKAQDLRAEMLSTMKRLGMKVDPRTTNA